jgi:quinol-cytochrome oxidoreductase complex cytochrome b subunit
MTETIEPFTTTKTPRPGRWRRSVDAFDERLGIKSLEYPVPEHANKLAYSLGGLSLITFMIMVGTGIFLTQYYDPDPTRAHASVVDITTGVTLGRFVRGIHYWGAMAMIVLVGLHLLRVFVSGSFKRPREGNWTIGVALAAITAGLFFTGSVVKWDQEAIEALSHNTEVGKMFGGFGTWFSPKFGGTPLLTRLFIVHIAVLPALFMLVIAGHLMLVKYHGMAPSPFRRASGPERSEPFTRHLARLAGYGLLLLSLLTVLATLFPPGVGHAPVAGIEVTKPAWPMLWVYPIEDAVGIKGIVWAAVAIFALLLLVPILDRGPERSPRRRIPMMVGATLVVATMLALIIYGASETVASHIGM